MTHFFSCDWGTSSFRLRRVNATTGAVQAQRLETSGVREMSVQGGTGQSRESIFANFLREQLRRMAGEDRGWLDGAAVVISGMASSNVGWRELPYASVPLNLDGAGMVREVFALEVGEGFQAEIHLISGVRAEVDIMRGEETEIFGIFAEGRHAGIAEDGLVVLPGTHSKHVHLRQRQITGFHTYMTGELFDVLSAHSLLRASVRVEAVAASGTLQKAECREAFAAGVQAARDDGLARRLFQTRVRTVLQFVPPEMNRWYLSGLLIGSELADVAAREGAERILLAAAEPLHTAYVLAFEILGIKKHLTVIPPEEMKLASARGHGLLLAAAHKTSMHRVH